MYQSSYVNTSKQKGFQLHGEDVSKSSKRRQRLFLILFSEAAASFPIANYFCLLWLVTFVTGRSPVWKLGRQGPRKNGLDLDWWPGSRLGCSTTIHPLHPPSLSVPLSALDVPSSAPQRWLSAALCAHMLQITCVYVCWQRLNFIEGVYWKWLIKDVFFFFSSYNGKQIFMEWFV